MRQRASELWSGPLPVSDPRTPIPSPRRIGIAVAVELGQLPSSGAHKSSEHVFLSFLALAWPFCGSYVNFRL